MLDMNNWIDCLKYLGKTMNKSHLMTINILKEESPTIPVHVLEIMTDNNYNVDGTILEFLKSFNSSTFTNILYRNFKDPI